MTAEDQDTEADERARQHKSWTGGTPFRRGDYLAQRGLAQARAPSQGWRPTPGAVGLSLASVVVFAFAILSVIAWSKAYPACRAMRETVGLYGEDTMETCTWRTTLHVLHLGLSQVVP